MTILMLMNGTPSSKGNFMIKKCERREQPLSTFDELLNEYEIEFTDEPDPEGAYIPAH